MKKLLVGQLVDQAIKLAVTLTGCTEVEAREHYKEDIAETYRLAGIEQDVKKLDPVQQFAIDGIITAEFLEQASRDTGIPKGFIEVLSERIGAGLQAGVSIEEQYQEHQRAKVEECPRIKALKEKVTNSIEWNKDAHPNHTRAGYIEALEDVQDWLREC